MRRGCGLCPFRQCVGRLRLGLLGDGMGLQCLQLMAQIASLLQRPLLLTLHVVDLRNERLYLCVQCADRFRHRTHL